MGVACILKVFFFGVRATINSHYIRHVKLVLVLFSLSACFCMGFAYILKVFSFFGVRAAILNPKSHYTRHVKLDFGVSVALCLFCMVLPVFLKVFSFLGSGQPS